MEIDNSELRVIGDFTTISALQSLRLRLRDPNIANRCKIAYNPSFVVVYFYIHLRDANFDQKKDKTVIHIQSKDCQKL